MRGARGPSWTPAIHKIERWWSASALSALGRGRATIQRLRAVTGLAGVRNQVQRPPSAIACSGCLRRKAGAAVTPEAIIAGRPRLKFYEAGMDLNLSLDRAESFRMFQARIQEQYDTMVESDKFVVMDGTMTVNRLQKLMREIVQKRVDLGRFAPKRQAEAPV